MSAEKYTYRVMWSEEDQEFVALCSEFQSLSFLARSQEAALKGIRNTVESVLKDMKKNKEKIPEPLSIRHYSGKIHVRIPPEVHMKLAIEAEEENISLNRLISSKLAS